MLSWVFGFFRWIYVALFVVMLVWLQTRLFTVPAGSFAVVRRRWCWWRKHREKDRVSKTAIAIVQRFAVAPRRKGKTGGNRGRPPPPPPRQGPLPG